MVARIEAIPLCSDQQSQLNCNVNRNGLELWTARRKDAIYSKDLPEKLAILDNAIKGNVATYLGGIPGISLPFLCFLKCVLNQMSSGFVCLFVFIEIGSFDIDLTVLEFITVDQAGLELKDLPNPLFCVLELKALAHLAKLIIS